MNSMSYKVNVFFVKNNVFTECVSTKQNLFPPICLILMRVLPGRFLNKIKTKNNHYYPHWQMGLTLFVLTSI